MPNSCKQKQYFISLTILAGMFFIFGFVSWVNSILIPYFRIACELTHFESYFVAFAFVFITIEQPKLIRNIRV